MLYYISWCPLYGRGELRNRVFDNAADRDYFVFLLGQVRHLHTWGVRA